ncbi:MAG: ABC transporter substrate-binding protein [Halobacterium sp.]
MVNDDKRDGRDGIDSKQTSGERTAPLSPAASRRSVLKTAGLGVTGMAGLAGCLGGGGGGQSGPVTIGVLAPHTGTENPIGNSIAEGAKLAANQLNGEDGVLGEDVEVVVKETNEKPQTGKDKYQELTVGEEVDVTTGVFTSEVLLNIMDSIASQETVHLTTGAATPEAATMVNENYDEYKYWFRTGPVNAHYLGTNMVDFADAKFSDMGWESVYVLVEDFAWTEPVDSVLEENLSDAGVEVVGKNRYASGTKDFSTIFDQVEESGADAAYVAMAHTGNAAITQWAKQQRPFAFGGIHVPAQLPSYYKLVKGACRFAVTQNSATPTSEVTEKTVPFADAYKEQVGKYPVYTGYITYDAVKQYAAAVEAAESRAADDVIGELESSTFTGTTGPINYYGHDADYTHDVVYDAEGEDGVRPLWFQWQEQDGSGKQVTVSPESLKQGSYRKPPWV